MYLLICSDGTDAADRAARLGGLIAARAQATVTLLGIAEAPGSEESLRKALESEAERLRGRGLKPEIVVRTGEPIDEILQQTKVADYDFAVLGARTRPRRGDSRRTYEVIKSIAPPILITAGECDSLSRILLCTGGKDYIEAGVQLTGQIAAAVGAAVTLFHVMAEPPAVYADLVRREEDVESLLAGDSELGKNLRTEKESLEKLGLAVEVRVRHGLVLQQIFAEMRHVDYDMIVIGSSRSGAFQQYILGDLTRSILNRSNCPVLIARSGHDGGLWNAIKRVFAG